MNRDPMPAADGRTEMLVEMLRQTEVEWTTHADDRTEPVLVEHVGTPAASEGAVAEKPPLRLRRLSQVQPRQVRWLVPGMIPLRTITLVAGIGGLGKSTYLAGVAAALSAGRFGDAADSIIVSLEDPAAEVIRPRLEAAGANLDRVHEVVVEGGFGSVRLPSDLAALAGLARDVQAKLIVVDPIVAAIETEYDAHKDQHVRAVLAGLAEMAEELTLAVALVGHLNKTPSRDAYLRVANSVAFWNAARSVVLVAEDPDDPDEFRLIAQRKSNWMRLRSVERHRMETIVLPDSVDPDTGKAIETSRLVFVEVADDVDGADVLAPPERHGKTGEAERWLRDALDDGEWHDSAGLKKLASFPDRTLQRAAQKLDVESDRRGFPSTTWWRLPHSRQGFTLKSGATEDSAQPSGLWPTLAPVAPTFRDDATGGATGAAALPLDLGTARLDDLKRAVADGAL